jgi:predicted DNA-binding antitoxin AbrB/MazE fold protein
MNLKEGGRRLIKMLALKAVVKDGLIKPLEAIGLPEDEEIVIYISEESPGKGTMIREGLNDEEIFLAATFQVAIEDDLEEDAIWRKYIK